DSAGWLNSERSLTTADLRGKIVVIDFFASWCGPCNAAMPDLVEFHQRYRDRGVMLVGLTSEPASELERIQQFDQRVEGVDWPIAYGARLAFEVTGIEGVPTYVLYDRTGKAVWSGASIDELERATVELLAME
ncbi:MAG: TlpA disulfide reductase family protein, partial [Pirellulales bacterium]